METLVVIPARGGSKGIPHKNIKELFGKPLICYSIDVAKKFTTDENICVTTDDDDIIHVVEKYGLKVPFKRPAELATDNCGSNEVIKHAYQYYLDKGKKYDVIILLQPTSPFRKVAFLKEALEMYDCSIDMVTSVMPASCNPYYDAYEEDNKGLLHISKGDGKIERRQNAPNVWQLNGSIYIINPKSLFQKGLSNFDKTRKYEMSELYSVDIDNMNDWYMAEMILKNKMIDL